mmetsp:Transcript_61278/g.147581  ORF Transcript_61278/g.147581 Transcript_61278/m.147581 type:complete len:228 (+) Transcript_61278:229-912(+)
MPGAGPMHSSASGHLGHLRPTAYLGMALRCSLRSWIEVSTRPCSSQNVRSSGTRDMLPSSLQISLSTPHSWRPASLQKSTEASVCPSRSSTPPSRGRSGKTWPGRLKSPGTVVGLARARKVAARSKAEIPVVVPSFTSTLTVKAVCLGSWLLMTMGGSSSSSSRLPFTATQITPEEYRLMKPIVSGVANSAAMIKSPSFSRSSSSVTTMILPALTASMAATTDLGPN